MIVENTVHFHFYRLLPSSTANTTYEQKCLFFFFFTYRLCKTRSGSDSKSEPKLPSSQGQRVKDPSTLVNYHVSPPTPNQFHRLLLTSQSQQAASMGAAESGKPRGKARRNTGCGAEPISPAVPPPPPASGGARDSRPGPRHLPLPHRCSKARRVARCRSKRQHRVKSREGRRTGSCCVVKRHSSAMAAESAGTEQRREELGWWWWWWEVT